MDHLLFSSAGKRRKRKERRKMRLPRTSFRPSLWSSGVNVAPFITCLSTRAWMPSTPLFLRWHSTCHGYCSVRQVVVFLVVAQRQIPHGLWDSPVAVHLYGRCPCCAAAARFHKSLTCPSVCNDRCWVDSECRTLWKFRSTHKTWVWRCLTRPTPMP